MGCLRCQALLVFPIVYTSLVIDASAPEVTAHQIKSTSKNCFFDSAGIKNKLFFMSSRLRGGFLDVHLT
jgi:hypothetical protein